jgi:queuosine precursor transporter
MKRTDGIVNIQIISISLYVAFQIFSDVLSTKIAYIPLIALAVDGGTVIYPFTFTLRDFVHKSCGKDNARRLIFISAAINVLMVLLFIGVGMLPAESSWPNQGAYQAILMPIWRITLASIIAEVISELIDTEIFDYYYRRMRDVLGVLVSNSVALVIDSVLFALIAFSGTMPWRTVAEIALANVLIKAALTLISLPTIRLIPRSLDAASAVVRRAKPRRK